MPGLVLSGRVRTGELSSALLLERAGKGVLCVGTRLLHSRGLAWLHVMCTAEGWRLIAFWTASTPHKVCILLSDLSIPCIRGWGVKGAHQCVGVDNIASVLRA